MTTDSYFARDGARIAYQFTGSGTPIGCAHGIFLSRQAVRRLELFDIDALAAGRRFLAYDQRGHGKSTGRAVPDDYRFENFTRDLLALLDALDLDEPMDFADYPKFDLTPDVADELLPSVLRGVGTSDLPAPEAIATLRHPTLILAWDTDPLHPVSTAERPHVSRSVEDIKSWTSRAAAFLDS